MLFFSGKKTSPKASIICLDRHVGKSDDGFTALKADQGVATARAEAIERFPQPVRLILDDGSHDPEHPQSTFPSPFKNRHGQKAPRSSKTSNISPDTGQSWRIHDQTRAIQ